MEQVAIFHWNSLESSKVCRLETPQHREESCLSGSLWLLLGNHRSLSYWGITQHSLRIQVIAVVSTNNGLHIKKLWLPRWSHSRCHQVRHEVSSRQRECLSLPAQENKVQGQIANWVGQANAFGYRQWQISNDWMGQRADGLWVTKGIWIPVEGWTFETAE